MSSITATIESYRNQPDTMSTRHPQPKSGPIVQFMHRLASLLPSLWSRRVAVGSLADGYDLMAQRQSDQQSASLYRDAASQIRCS